MQKWSQRRQRNDRSHARDATNGVTAHQGSTRSKRAPSSAQQPRTAYALEIFNKSRTNKNSAPPTPTSPDARAGASTSPPGASRPRQPTSAAKAATLVHANAAIANGFVLAAAATLSVMDKQATNLATMQLQQTQARRQEQLRHSIQQHHQMRRALRSCINPRSTCCRRQAPYRLQQPPPPQHPPTTPGRRVHFHHATVTRLRVYNPANPPPPPALPCALTRDAQQSLSPSAQLQRRSSQTRAHQRSQYRPPVGTSKAPCMTPPCHSASDQTTKLACSRTATLWIHYAVSPH